MPIHKQWTYSVNAMPDEHYGWTLYATGEGPILTGYQQKDPSEVLGHIVTLQTQFLSQ